MGLAIKRGPGLYARVLALVFEAHQVSTNPLFGGSDPKAMILQAQKETKLPGASTLCVVEIDKSGQLRAANVGDSGFKVIRGGEVVFESTPSQHYFNCPFQLGYMPLSADADDANSAGQYSFKAMEGGVVVQKRGRVCRVFEGWPGGREQLQSRFVTKRWQMCRRHCPRV